MPVASVNDKRRIKEMRSLRCEQNSASDEKNSSTSVPWRHFIMSVRDSVANSSQGYGVALPCLK